MDILLIMVRVMGERGMEQPVDYEVMDTQQCVLHGSVLHTLLRAAEAINPFDMDEGGRKEQVGGTKGQCCTPPRRPAARCVVYTDCLIYVQAASRLADSSCAFSLGRHQCHTTSVLDTTMCWDRQKGGTCVSMHDHSSIAVSSDDGKRLSISVVLLYTLIQGQ
jgi:hypothetical protein